MSDDNKVLGASEDQAGSIRVSDAELVSANVTGWPKRIYLQSGCDEVPVYDEVRGSEVTWCADNIHDSDVEYVRSDLAAATAEQPSLSVPPGTGGEQEVMPWQQRHALGDSIEGAMACEIRDWRALATRRPVAPELAVFDEDSARKAANAWALGRYGTSDILSKEECRTAVYTAAEGYYAALKSAPPVAAVAPELSDKQPSAFMVERPSDKHVFGIYTSRADAESTAKWDATNEIVPLFRSIPSKVSPVELTLTQRQHIKNAVATLEGSGYGTTAASLNDILSAAPVERLLAPTGLTVEQEPKYGGTLFNRASGEAIPTDEPVFIFRARDTYAVNVLAQYGRMLPDGQHRAAVWTRVADFKRFWADHPERMKEPDTALLAPTPAPTGDTK